ncbi:hypothetical protein Hanom_Chr06g00511161 [Helianthus anomalus]
MNHENANLITKNWTRSQWVSPRFNRLDESGSSRVRARSINQVYLSMFNSSFLGLISLGYDEIANAILVANRVLPEIVGSKGKKRLAELEP